MAAADLPVYLTIPEVAQILRIGVWPATRLCRNGDIPATKPGKSWLVTPSDLQAYIDSGRNDIEASA